MYGGGNLRPGGLWKGRGGRATHRGAGGSRGKFDDGGYAAMGRFGEGGVHGRDEVGLWLWRGRGGCVG